MINYSAIIDILESGHYADKTGCFERFTNFHHETLTNCSGTGASLFLKTLACFLEKSIDAKNIKVYACIEDEKAELVFIESLKHLISHAEHTFGAKIATCCRADQMCYWVYANDYKHLESFFRPYFSEMKTPLPFVAYKGRLGISRDFPGWDDSHKATQAHIISDYMKTVNSVEQVDLEDMYNNYIAKWNADIEVEDDYGSFKRESVLSLVVILDSLDAILGKTPLSEESLLLSGDKRIWHILADSRCWSDVNER